MEAQTGIELVMLLLVVATGLGYLARRLGIAYPIVLVLGGLVLGLVFSWVPDAPTVELPPDVVFLIFLPPILFGAAYDTPIRDFKANLRAIGLLAVGLVLFTALVVAAVMSALIPELGWWPALALGAIVAPPDAVAATSILRRLGVPTKVVTILEGESLVNDATALILLRVAIMAIPAGAFSLVEASASFVVVGLGGIAVGVVIGWLITTAWRRTSDATLEIALSLLAPLTAYLAGEALGVSGVLATVTAGIIAGRKAARALSPDGRLMGRGVWSVILFLINGFAFLLIGLQLPAILDAMDREPAELIGLGVAVSVTVIVARIVWVFPATYVPRWLSPRLRQRDPVPPNGAIFVVSWAGMRGVVSLAAALALPFDVPDRDLIIYLTFCVILATLVGQGLTLPWVIRAVGLVRGTHEEREEAQARQVAVEAAAERLEELGEAYPDHMELIVQLRARYDEEASHAWPEPSEGGPTEADQERLDHQAIRMSLISAQRDAIIRLRDDGVIGDEALHRVERDLDLEAVRSGL
jgi:CPA1 family monovalent cation:H+ antiporter